MDDTQLIKTVQNMKENEFTFSEISTFLKLSKPTVRRIYLTGEVPPCAKKILEPSAKLLSTRARRVKLNEIARLWNHKSWSDFETQSIRDFEKAGLI